jgi:predicted glycosyltransferase involved in capsule biosynthesis
MPYCRSWAFNVGAKIARGDLLIFHDNDIIIPAHYGSELAILYKKSYECMSIQRFVFELSENDTENLINRKEIGINLRPRAIIQNSQGFSIAIKKETFFEIGGYDEKFIGWGGEDNEIFERCEAKKMYAYGYLPFIHLYHTAQAGKNEENIGYKYYCERAKVNIKRRIEELSKHPIGMRQGPYGYGK